ncbi:MAG: hypothetical protein QM500_05705 [Methylococcales bacterium]
MVKKSIPLDMGPKSKQVTVKMTMDLKDSLPLAILNDGYNMRQKSKWVVEAVQSLLSNSEWEGALLSEVLVKPDTKDVFRIPSDILATINKEAARVAMENSSLRANQSSIIRASINRRLLGFFTKVD